MVPNKMSLHLVAKQLKLYMHAYTFRLSGDTIALLIKGGKV